MNIMNTLAHRVGGRKDHLLLGTHCRMFIFPIDMWKDPHTAKDG